MHRPIVLRLGAPAEIAVSCMLTSLPINQRSIRTISQVAGEASVGRTERGAPTVDVSGFSATESDEGFGSEEDSEDHTQICGTPEWAHG